MLLLAGIIFSFSGVWCHFCHIRHGSHLVPHLPHLREGLGDQEHQQVLLPQVLHVHHQVDDSPDLVCCSHYKYSALV